MENQVLPLFNTVLTQQQAEPILRLLQMSKNSLEESKISMNEKGKLSGLTEKSSQSFSSEVSGKKSIVDVKTPDISSLEKSAKKISQAL